MLITGTSLYKCNPKFAFYNKIGGKSGVGIKMKNELRHEKTNVLVSDLVQHKPGCTATEDG